MGNQHGKERRNYGRRIDWEHAERPSPPGKPFLVPENPDQQPDVITIRWSPPSSDGGAPIIGYLVEHRRTGSPHWLRASPVLAIDPELTLTGLEPGWRYQFRVSAENDIGRSDPGELSEPLTVTVQRSAASAPHFNRELQDSIALENEKVEFVVHVIATPAPKISWYKDGFEIFSSRRTKIVTENDQSTLIIHQAALEDEGEIKCTATNRAGHVVTKANLKLEAPPRIRLPRNYEEGLLFEKGEVIRLKVSTAGRPLPVVAWHHNNQVLANSDRYEITDTERSSMLRINEAARGDRGEYMVKGSNKIGEDFASFLVTITDRPSPPGKAKIVMTLGRSVTLAWASPEDDGGCKIGNYIVEYFRVGWNMWLKASTCRQLTTVLGELIEGSEYKFRVKAENPYGVSDPGEESEVIFIPDPKRGILEPPKREIEITDTWLEDGKKRPSDGEEGQKRPSDSEEVRDVSQEAKRRRLLEENARKLLDTPLPILLAQERAKVLEKPPRKDKPLTPSASPNLNRTSDGLYEQREATKRHMEDIDVENVPPPVPKRKNKTDKLNVTPTPDGGKTSPQPEEVSENESAHSRINFQNEKLTSPSFIQKQISFTSFDKTAKGDVSPYLSVPSAYPRENDDSVLHGSSELMLVLLPEERSKSAELSNQHRSEIEMSLAESGVAPPMSLSAPELGSGEPLEMPLLRDAVSSSELLHERAMARFYQDAADEEAQRMLKRRYSADRKSVERRGSLRDGNILERRHSMKENVHFEKPDAIQEEKLTDSNSKKLAELKSPSTEHEKEKTPETKSKIPVKKDSKKVESEASQPIVERPLDVDQLKNSSIPLLKKEISSPETKPKSILLRKEERLSSVEREQLEFALVRDRIRQKNDQNLKHVPLPPRPPTLQQQSSMSSQLSSYDGEELEDEECIEEEEDEEEYYLEEYEDDEEVEEEDEEKEELEEEEEPKQEKALNDLKFRPKALQLETPPPVPKHAAPPVAPKEEKPVKPERKAPRAEEEDIYRPRNMVPIRSVFVKLETPLPTTKEHPEETAPEEPTEDKKFNEPPAHSRTPTVEVRPPAALKSGIPQLVTKSSTPDLPKLEKPDVALEENKEVSSKIPLPASKAVKKKTAILKKIEKLALKRDKKKPTPTIESLIVDSTAPITSVVLPKPILKKKSMLKRKDKDTTKSDGKSDFNKNSSSLVESSSADADDDISSRRKKQVRIAEPGAEPTNERDPRRTQSMDEDEQGSRVLICHYSDIVREFGGARRNPPKLYLNYEELKAHVDPQEDNSKNVETLVSVVPSTKVTETEEPTIHSDTEERGSILDMSEVDNISITSSGNVEIALDASETALTETKTPSPEPEEVPSGLSSPDRTHSPSPVSLRPMTPEERVRSFMEYTTDVFMFLVACWLYLFKNELYAIPVLCLMVYRQVSDTVQDKYQRIKETISGKIPDKFKKKSNEDENETNEKDKED